MIIYIVLVINKICYEWKVYKIDIKHLEHEKKFNIGKMQTELIRNGSARYTPKMADGIMSATKEAADEEIILRKAKFKHDVIASSLTSILQPFKK